jgi:hypothetical protein
MTCNTYSCFILKEKRRRDKMKANCKDSPDKQIDPIKDTEDIMENQSYDSKDKNANKDSKTGLDSESPQDWLNDAFTPKRVCRFNEPQLPAKHQEWRIKFLRFLETCVNARAISYSRYFGGFEWVVFDESKYSRICQEYGYSDKDFETIQRY